MKSIIYIFIIFSIVGISCKSKAQKIREEIAREADSSIARMEREKKAMKESEWKREILEKYIEEQELTNIGLIKTTYLSNCQVAKGEGLEKTTSDATASITFMDSKAASFPYYKKNDLANLPEGTIQLSFKDREPIKLSLVFIKPQTAIPNQDFYKITSNSLYEFLYVFQGEYHILNKDYTHMIILCSHKKNSELPKNPEDFSEYFTFYCNKY